ncbi:MAG: ATP-binding cassette domain-containing protein, partial [Candidatus Syntropharchaeales archaeon]
MGGVAVLDDINFTIKEGEGFGILGKSGSGKSVLMHT